MASAFNLRKEEPPHLHIGVSKDELMLKTLATMLIPTGIAIYAIGSSALYHLTAAVATGLGVHYIIYLVQTAQKKKPTYSTPYSHLVAVLIAGLTMPASAPIPVTVAVAGLTSLVFKQGQGTLFDSKRVNPAAAAKALLLTLISVMVFLPDPLREGMIFHPHHLRLELFSADAFFTSVNRLYSTDTLTAFQSLLLWKTHGWMGGVSGVAVLLVGITLTFWIKLKWRIILSFLLTMTILSAATGLVTGGYVLLRIAFHVFTGSVIFFAFFMATEPQTTPMTMAGQYLFGFSLALITFTLHLLNVLGGSIFALVAMNLLTDKFDGILLKKPYGHDGGA